VAEPYWYGLLLVGGIFLLFTAVLLILTPLIQARDTSVLKVTKSRWNTDYLCLLSIAIFFYVAWGFGLPSLHPLNIGAARIIFQVIFIMSSFLLGVFVVLSLILYNPCKGKRKSTFSEVQAANENPYKDNVYMMEKKEDEDNISYTVPDYNEQQLGSMDDGDDPEIKLDLARSEF
jgi:hypothetical protein